MAKKIPGRVIIDGEKYVAVLLKIRSTYENGIPEDLTHLPNDQYVELTGGEQFMVVYAKESVVIK